MMLSNCCLMQGTPDLRYEILCFSSMRLPQRSQTPRTDQESPTKAPSLLRPRRGRLYATCASVCFPFHTGRLTRQRETSILPCVLAREYSLCLVARFESSIASLMRKTKKINDWARAKILYCRHNFLLLYYYLFDYASWPFGALSKIFDKFYHRFHET